MSPENARDKIADLVAGRLDEATAEKVRAYLLTDDEAREFYEQVSALYELDLEPDVRAPEVLQPYHGGAAFGGWRRFAAVAAALALVVAGALLAPDFFGERGDDDAIGNDASVAQAPVRFDPVPLMQVAVELPELPDAYHAGEWLDSREEAVLTAKFTGKPLLESYINPGCPVSQYVDEDLCATRRQEVLEHFVCYREKFAGDVPEPVCGEVDSKQIVKMLPALRVSIGECEPETHWGIRDWEGVEKEIQSYVARCKEQGGSDKECLGRAGFEYNLKTLHRVVRLLDEGKVAEGLQALEGILRCQVSCKTEFGSTARSLQTQILEGVERQLERIAVLSRGNEVEQAQAADLASRFAEQVEGLEVESRVREYCRDRQGCRASQGNEESEEE